VNSAKITRADNLRTKFLASNVHSNHLSFDLLGSRSLPYGGLKFGYSFTTIIILLHAVGLH